MLYLRITGMEYFLIITYSSGNFFCPAFYFLIYTVRNIKTCVWILFYVFIQLHYQLPIIRIMADNNALPIIEIPYGVMDMPDILIVNMVSLL